MEVVASLSQGRTAAAQCGLFTYKSVPVIFEPPCTWTGVAGVSIRRDKFNFCILIHSQEFVATLGALRGHAVRLYGRVVSSGRLSLIKPTPGLPNHGTRAQNGRRNDFLCKRHSLLSQLLFLCPTRVSLL